MFTLIKSDTGAVVPFEHLPAAAGTYSVGQPLAASADGVSGETAAPTHLSMKDGTVEEGALIPTAAIQVNAVYECESSDESALTRAHTVIGTDEDAGTVRIRFE